MAGRTTVHKIQVKLSRLVYGCSEDHITVADKISKVIGSNQVELLNPVDYTKEEFIKKFLGKGKGNKMIGNWWHTTDNGIDYLVIVMD